MPNKLTTESFKEKLAVKHPNLELLSEYNGSMEYVTVRCKIHDYVFRTTPKRLQAGNGCQKCYDDRRGDTIRKTTEQFIKEARAIHGDKFDYSKVNYVNSQTKVCIICPKHGEFWQTPDKHTSGKHGCPKCAGRNKSTESVIEEFRSVHGDQYDYSEVNYTNNSTKVTIICRKHGKFLQRPDVHLMGSGCPICKESRLEMSVRAFLSDNNVLYERQKHFDWLGKQSLDFYLPEYNLGIECQGEQHFCESHGIYITKSQLSDRIRRDVTKKTLCDDNSVDMLYVMDKRWLKKCFQAKFNCIYTEDNIILSDCLENILEKIRKP